MQRRKQDNPIVRFAGSTATALCIVSAMLWLGLELSGFTGRVERRALDAHEVDILSDAEQLNLRALLGEGRYGLKLPALPESPNVPTRRADARGFVRLDVEVDARGEIADVRVIDASPPGIFEAQAIAEVRRRTYAPDVVDGVAVPSRHLEIVDFTLAPAAGPHDTRE